MASSKNKDFHLKECVCVCVCVCVRVCVLGGYRREHGLKWVKDQQKS